MNYATVTDVEALWRPLSVQEQKRAEALIPIICASLRSEASKVGKNLDDMILANPDLGYVAKSVVVDVLGRTLLTSTENEPMTTFSEGALGYSVSGTYLVPGGGLFIKKSELARLCLKRQRIGLVDMSGSDSDD